MGKVKTVDCSGCRRGCTYMGEVGGSKYCKFYLLTGIRRPCPPGQDCEVYKKGRRQMLPREDLWEA